MCIRDRFRPYATSLRMSDLGYQNRAQDQLHVSFNSLAEYTQALEIAIRTPDPVSYTHLCTSLAHSNHAEQPSMSGMPPIPRLVATPSKRSLLSVAAKQSEIPC